MLPDVVVAAARAHLLETDGESDAGVALRQPEPSGVADESGGALQVQPEGQPSGGGVLDAQLEPIQHPLRQSRSFLSE